MDSLIAAKRWYDTVAVPYKQGEKGEGKQLFVKLFGKGAKQPIAFIREGTPDMIWEDVQFLINSQSAAYSAFEIHVCSALQDDKALKYTVMLYPGTGNTYQQQNGQVAGIGSVPGVYGGYPSAESIGAIEKRIEEKFEQRMAHEKALREKDDEISLLKFEKSQRKKKGDIVEQIGLFCQEQEIDLNPLIAQIPQLISGLFSRKSAPMRGVAGLPGQGGHDVHRHMTDKPIPNDQGSEMEETDEDPNHEAMNEAVYKELLYAGGHDQSSLDIEFAKVIFATIKLHQFIGGMKQMKLVGDDLDAADILVKTADFIIENPKKAQELVKQMRGDTNQSEA